MLFRLLLLFLLLSHEASAQRSFLFIKKRGIKKVDTYYEGSPIRIRAEFGYVEGYITRIKSDSLFINTLAISFADIREVVVRPKKKDPYLKEQLLYTAAGMVITTTGMTLAKWTDWRTALATSASIAGASYVPRLFRIFKRRRYRIGKKFTLSPIDLQFGLRQAPPATRSF